MFQMKKEDKIKGSSTQIQNTDRLSKAMAEIVKEEGYAAQAVAQDVRVRKERFHHFETDFAMKLEKMSQVLQLEMESRAADAESKIVGIPNKKLQERKTIKNDQMVQQI